MPQSGHATPMILHHSARADLINRELRRSKPRLATGVSFFDDCEPAVRLAGPSGAQVFRWRESPAVNWITCGIAEPV
jgi:hypothetical protein